jgi:hypothetical protein
VSPDFKTKTMQFLPLEAIVAGFGATQRTSANRVLKAKIRSRSAFFVIRLHKIDNLQTSIRSA